MSEKSGLKKGDIAPDFTLKNSDNVEISLKDFRGKNVILYFYPKDNTPGCTLEACDFSDNYENFIDKNSVILGVSPDSVNSHSNFKSKKNLKHILLSDEDKEVAKLYGVWKLKKNFGKEYYGIARTTFLIDLDGKITKIYNNVKVKDHAKKVLDDIG